MPIIREHKNSLTLDVDSCSYTSAGRSSITSTPVSLASTSAERTWNFRINYPPEFEERRLKRRKPATVIGTVVVLVLLAIMIAVAVMVATEKNGERSNLAPPVEPQRRCSQECRLSFAETIPEGMKINGNFTLESTYDSWLELLRTAQRTADIVSSTWGLAAGSGTAGVTQGHRLLEELISAGTSRNVRTRILYDERAAIASELHTLAEMGAAMVRGVHLDHLLKKKQSRVYGNLLIVDEQAFYLGSAAFSWRSFLQDKDFGAVVSNCTCLARDVTKLFSNLWELAAPSAHAPSSWPAHEGVASFSSAHHMCLNSDINTTALVTVSPPVLGQGDNSSTLRAVLNVINNAREYLDVAVRDYLPSSRTDEHSYWPVLQEALSRATLTRAIRVRLLASTWENTPPAMYNYLRSLSDLDGLGGGHIHVRLFNITGPDGQVLRGSNNNRYIYSENSVFIGTSDWTQDDFEDNVAFGLLLNQTTPGFHGNVTDDSIHQQLKAVFERDWNSGNARPLP